MLLATSAEEVALWRRASSLFNKAPPELHPPELEVDTSNNVDDQSSRSNVFCGSMVELISCPAFEGNSIFLFFAIRSSIYRRLGDYDNCGAPDVTDASGD
jgi:hypothetical protein